MTTYMFVMLQNSICVLVGVRKVNKFVNSGLRREVFLKQQTANDIRRPQVIVPFYSPVSYY